MENNQRSDLNSPDLTSVEDRKVVKNTREAVVKVATGARRLKDKTVDLKKRAEQKWQDTKPFQQKVKSNIQGAGKRVVDFGKDVSQGVREGVTAVVG